MSKNGVWSVDDELAVLPPTVSSIAEMLRASAKRGDFIDLKDTALKAANMLERKSCAGMYGTVPTFRDEIGC